MPRPPVHNIRHQMELSCPPSPAGDQVEVAPLGEQDAVPQSRWVAGKRNPVVEEEPAPNDINPHRLAGHWVHGE